MKNLIDLKDISKNGVLVSTGISRREKKLLEKSLLVWKLKRN
jgi:hypothetical protein